MTLVDANQAHRLVMFAKKMTTNEDIMSCLNKMKVQASLNNEALRKDVNEKLVTLTDKIDKVKDDALEKEKKNDLKMLNLMKRLDSIESKMKDKKDKSDEKAEEREKQRERTKTFKDSVGLIDEAPDNSRVKTWSEIVDESREKDEVKKVKEKERITKHWTKKVIVKTRKDKVTPEDEEKEDRKKKDEVRRLVLEEEEREELRLEPSLHAEDDWSWEDSDIDWQGTIERNEVTKKRKVDRYRRKKLLEMKVAKKAKHMLGLGPIRRDSISYFHNIVGDLEDAKKMAINEFLSEYLQLNEEERKDFDIIDTTFAKNEDDLIYVTFRDFESVKEIRRRVAIIRNDEIKVRIFIPPQFWTRYRFLSNYCADERAKNSNFKTMIRFTDTDMEVLFKDKSNEDQYNAVPLKDIENEVGKIPKFDHSLSWKLRVDRPSRSTLKTISEAVRPPSLGGARLQKQTSSSSSASSGPSLPSKRFKSSHNSDQNMDIEVETIEGLSDKSL